MASPRLCSECGASLAGRKANTKTCSVECRSKRSRRLRGITKHTREELELPEEVQAIRQVVRGERDDVVDRVVQEELRPVVREAITEDTMRAIADLIALTPAAVAAIGEDLASDDATIRQRAYSLITKYTIGHPAIVRPPEESADKQIVVNFNVDRPAEETAVPVLETSVTDALKTEYTKQCDMCGEDKPEDQFVAGSFRCTVCFNSQQERSRNLFADG